MKGLHPDSCWVPSPNFDEREEPVQIDTLVIHYTALELAETLELLCRPGHRASTHYVITREGGLYQLVAEPHRAWHAGVSRLGEREAVNNFSIGIDLVHVPEVDLSGYSCHQYEGLRSLIRTLVDKYPIAHITGHEHVAVPRGRKTDPGPRFDWMELEDFADLIIGPGTFDS